MASPRRRPPLTGIGEALPRSLLLAFALTAAYPLLLLAAFGF